MEKAAIVQSDCRHQATLEDHIGRILRHWVTLHADNKVRAAACTKRYLHKYVRCQALFADYSDGTQPAHDGVTELWFDFVADNAAFFSDPKYLSDIKPDQSEFADMTLTVAFQTQE